MAEERSTSSTDDASAAPRRRKRDAVLARRRSLKAVVQQEDFTTETCASTTTNAKNNTPTRLGTVATRRRLLQKFSARSPPRSEASTCSDVPTDDESGMPPVRVNSGVLLARAENDSDEDEDFLAAKDKPVDNNELVDERNCDVLGYVASLHSTRSYEDPGEDMPERPMMVRDPPSKMEEEEKKEKETEVTDLLLSFHADPSIVGTSGTQVDPLGWPKQESSHDTYCTPENETCIDHGDDETHRPGVVSKAVHIPPYTLPPEGSSSLAETKSHAHKEINILEDDASNAFVPPYGSTMGKPMDQASLPVRTEYLTLGRPPRGSSSPTPPPPPPGSKKKVRRNARSSDVSHGKPPPENHRSEVTAKVQQIETEVSDPSPGDATYLEMEPPQGQGPLVDSPKKTWKPSSGDLSRSPVSSSSVIQDVKMAEKVEWAISAASSKFEEQVAHSPSKDRISSSSSSLSSCGVFPTWGIPDSSSIPEQIPVLSSRKDLSQIEKTASLSRRSIFPDGHPSPFEDAITENSRVISHLLSFLGDPVAVCRIGAVSKACHTYVGANEYILIRDSVRLGGISKNVRPYFWLWVTLEKFSGGDLDTSFDSDLSSMTQEGFCQLQRLGRAGKWNHIIERDVSRAFGNLPPHKTGARLRTDSIVRALVSWGRCRMMKQGVKGKGDAPPNGPRNSFDSDEVSLTPTDTVSDWGGVDPVGSVASGEKDDSEISRRKGHSRAEGEMALSGNFLADDVKVTLQEKLSFILHALAASHDDVGYCQGMDYVVAHLLRILPETIRWQAVKGTLPSIVQSARGPLFEEPLTAGAFAKRYSEVNSSLVVEETCYRVMDAFFTTYSLRHFYYPELRCLKTCCRVFEKLIQLKLPVLADHFDHHELNVGLFALGWFQTLFLYLPSMPSATVCHMWDIWLVERSYKIFFRVGTAILFLSQPILLNHELEGMMSYLNTFPDATLLSPDILIPCSLQIKVTNKILMELEGEVANTML
jgi:hypothetical protein